MHNFQSKIPYPQPNTAKGNEQRNEINKGLLLSPANVDMTQSLNLIQFKCCQDIMKQKKDQSSKDVPFSYSKSIQYLNVDNKQFSQFKELPSLDDKFSLTQTQAMSDRNTHTKFNFSKNPATILGNRKYWSPMNSRVQRFLKKTQKNDEVSQLSRNMREINGNKGEMQPDSKYNDIQESQIIEASEFKPLFGGDKALSSRNGASKNDKEIISSFIKQQILLSKLNPKVFISESYALKGSNKIAQPQERPPQKVFTPLKLTPPFVKQAYLESNKSSSLGFMGSNPSIKGSSQFDIQPVIHSNDRLRADWQNRIATSLPKQSIQSTFRYTFQQKNKSLQLIPHSSIQSSHFGYKTNNFENPKTSVDFFKDNLELEKIDFENTKEQMQKNEQYLIFEEQEFNDIPEQFKIGDSDKTNRIIIQSPTSSVTQQLSQPNQEGFNHFYKSNLLKKDLEFLNQLKNKSQLNNQRGTRSNQQLLDPEIIIQNQLPGSKVLMKRSHQKTYTNSNISPNQMSSKVCHTVSDRASFFKQKPGALTSIKYNNLYD